MGLSGSYRLVTFARDIRACHTPRLPWHRRFDPLAPVATTGSSGGSGVAYEENIPPELLDLVTGDPVDGSEFEGHLLRWIIRIFGIRPVLPL